jgi:hypothetical protein
MANFGLNSLEDIEATATAIFKKLHQNKNDATNSGKCSTVQKGCATTMLCCRPPTPLASCW